MLSDRLVAASWLGTLVFTGVAIAAVVDVDLEGAAAALSMALFVVGVGLFFWAYAIAVGRSRTDAIGIGGLYFLAGEGTAPPPIRWALLGSLAVEAVVAVTTAAIRPFTPLAFGVLVPMFGLGVCGLWAARSGRFPPRSGPDANG